MDDVTRLRIGSILRHINMVLDDTKGLSLEELSESSLILRATCFSLVQIGEEMNRLKEKLGDKYSNLPWIEAPVMRNIIVHDYNKVNVELVYLTVKNNLPNLKIAFEKINGELQ